MALQDRVNEPVLDGCRVLDRWKGKPQGSKDRGPEAESLEAELVRVGMAPDGIARTLVEVPQVSVCSA